MAAPKVQSLGQILKELEPAFAQSRSLTNQQITALGGQETTALGALDVAKGNAFRDVNTGANSKGLAFSGIPAAEQTRYLGEKYLPAVAGVKQATATSRLTLQQALAQLEKEKYTTGLGTREKQKDILQRYMEAERDRQFRAAEAAKQRAFTAQQNAASRAASAAAAVQKGAPANLVKNVYGLLNSKKGRDGFVSPGTFRAGMAQWTNAGGSPDSYIATYSGFVNKFHQKHWGGYY